MKNIFNIFHPIFHNNKLKNKNKICLDGYIEPSETSNSEVSGENN